MPSNSEEPLLTQFYHLGGGLGGGWTEVSLVDLEVDPRDC